MDETQQSSQNLFLCCGVAASGGEELMHWSSSRIRLFFFSSSSYSSRPWFLGFQCHSRFKSALTGLQHISISPLSLHSLPLMSPWSSDMLTGTSMLTSFSLPAENILFPAVREQTFSFPPSGFTIDQRLCWTPELLYTLLMNLDGCSRMLTGKMGVLYAALLWRLLGSGLL